MNNTIIYSFEHTSKLSADRHAIELSIDGWTVIVTGNTTLWYLA